MNIIEVKSAVIEILTADLVPHLTGTPSGRKSDIIKSIAKDFKLEVIDIRLSQCDPCDMLGFPSHNGERMGYMPPEHFPLQGLDKPTEGYNGWLLFLDEFNSAPLSVQAAAYRLVLDREVGKHSLHKKCAIVCAGNKESDGAIVNRMSTAMQSRLIHLEMEVDVRAWLDWATAANLDHRAISYIEGHPDHLHQFDPNHNDKTFSCPRTWHYTSKLISGKEPTPLIQKMLVGTLSAGIGHEFYSYLHYCSELPSLQEIEKRPDDIAIPDEPALLYATSHMVAAYITDNNAPRLMRYIERLPLDFGVTSLRAALKRNVDLMKVEEVRDFANRIANEIF